jgi:hypothetical protein
VLIGREKDFYEEVGSALKRSCKSPPVPWQKIFSIFLKNPFSSPIKTHIPFF